MDKKIIYDKQESKKTLQINTVYVNCINKILYKFYYLEV